MFHNVSFTPPALWTIALVLGTLLNLYRTSVYEKGRKTNILKARELQLGRAWALPTNTVEVNRRSTSLFILMLTTGIGTFLSLVNMGIDVYLAQ